MERRAAALISVQATRKACDYAGFPARHKTSAGACGRSDGTVAARAADGIGGFRVWAPRELSERRSSMAAGKAMTKSEVAAQIAEKVGITKKQASKFFEAQAELAYRQAKNTFTIPGIGKLVMRERPARTMVMRFGPDAGKEKMIPKKKVVKFRLAKAAKDAILGAKK
jgi:DNA-binding protein HU-beta